MRRPVLALVLGACASVAQAATIPVRECPVAERAPAALLKADGAVALKVQRCVRYIDAAGDWQLYWLGSEEQRDGDFTLSSRLVAQLFKRQPDGSLAQQWILREHAAPDEAGAWFSRHLSEFRDLDGSGVVTTMLVLRLVPWRNDDKHAEGANEDDDAGRLKIVLFHGDTPATVEAITGPLDDERHTTASEPYFALPEATRRHVQQRLRQWNSDQVFLNDDNHGGFVPRHAKKKR